MTKRTHCGEERRGSDKRRRHRYRSRSDEGDSDREESVAKFKKGSPLTPMALLRRLYINETGRGAALGQDTVTPTTTTTTGTADVVAMVTMHLAKKTVTRSRSLSSGRRSHSRSTERKIDSRSRRASDHDPRYFQTTMTISWTVDHNPKMPNAVVYRLLPEDGIRPERPKVIIANQTLKTKMKTKPMKYVIIAGGLAVGHQYQVLDLNVIPLLQSSFTSRSHSSQSLVCPVPIPPPPQSPITTPIQNG